MTISSQPLLTPSHLGDLIARVKAMFGKVGQMIPIQIGEHYLTANQGNPPKIVFIPELNGSNIGAPVGGMPHVASWGHGCQVIVRHKPGLEEWNRYDNAYALAEKLIAAIALAGSGRIEWGQIAADPFTKDDKLGGVGVRFAFTFRRDVLHWKDIWDLSSEDSGKPEVARPQDLAGYTPAPAGTTPESAIATAMTPTVTVTVEDE